MRMFSSCRLLLVLLAGAIPTAAHAATVQDFETAGSAYTPLQLDHPPAAAVLAEGGGHFLRLVDAAGTPPIHNTLTFARTDAGPFCGFSAGFDFRITATAGRADGLGFALLDTSFFARGGGVSVEGPLFAAEEPSFRHSLGIGFDVFQSAGDPDANHVSVHWNGQRLTQVSAGALDLAGGQWIHAAITASLGPAPQLSLTLTPSGGSPVALITNLAVPGLEPYEGRVWLGARGGGLVASQDLDNLSVTYTACPATQVGAMSASQTWPIVSIHSHLLPDGKVMFWDRRDVLGDGDPRFWDPQTGAVTTAPLQPAAHDMFCTGHTLLADGRLFVAGGHIVDGIGQSFTSLFNPATGTWQSQPLMNAGRWYPSAVTLANGDALVVSGRSNDALGMDTLPQVWQAASGTWRNLTAAQLQLPFYPMLFLAPDGRVFVAGPADQSGYFDTAGSGAWSVLGNSSFGFRDYGSAALYADGKVMLAGGGDPPVDGVEVIDLRAATPQWRTVEPMTYARRQNNLTLLPDGTVLVTGGTWGGGFNNGDTPVFQTELWDPQSETWSPLAVLNEARLYHSEGLLLPDGRVLIAGGGHPRGDGADSDHFTAEIYSPPYLFRGPRPTVTGLPSNIGYSDAFNVGTPDGAGIAQVVLLRLGSVTHALNMNQRINRLAFTPIAGGLRVTAPADPRLCPPGHYMLFLLDANGVPSVAKILRIGSVALFADGFESGTTGAWSQTIGVPPRGD